MYRCYSYKRLLPVAYRNSNLCEGAGGARLIFISGGSGHEITYFYVKRMMTAVLGARLGARLGVRLGARRLVYTSAVLGRKINSCCHSCNVHCCREHAGTHAQRH